MVLKEIESEALKLPEEQRAQLAERLLASLRGQRTLPPDDPIFEIGTSPVDDEDEVSDGSVNHDRYIYG
jgi:hypothetical protein